MVKIKYVQIQETGPVENLGKRCLCRSVTLSYQNENKARSELLSNYYLVLLTSLAPTTVKKFSSLPYF